MKFLELANKRRSIRAFEPTKIEDEKLAYILEAARLSPSAVNFQPWLFLKVCGENGRNKLQECYKREWFKQAPCYLVICGNHDESWKRGDEKDFMDIDVAIAAEHVCLAAAEIGIGSCWVCNFDVDLCRRNFNIPDNIEPVVLIPLGYPSNHSAFNEDNKKRKALEEIVREETF